MKIREAGGANPWEPIDHLESIIENADDVKGATPAIFPSIIDMVIERVINQNMEIEAVLEDDAFKQMLDQHPQATQSFIEHPCTVYTTDEKIKYGIIIADEKRVVLVVFDESIRLLATLTSSSEESVWWALDYFDTLRESGDEVFFRRSTTSATNSVRASIPIL